MTPWTIWIALAALSAAMEMITGTFYLLVAALGAGAGAMVAYAGLSIAVQIGVAAVVSLAGWGLLYQFGPQQSRKDHRSNPDVNPDIGATVRLAHIKHDAAVVEYRGALWAAEVENGPPDLHQNYVIIRVEGAKLILAPKA
jgi:membrane protein implicated in regulation of membrane protease activity